MSVGVGLISMYHCIRFLGQNFCFELVFEQNLLFSGLNFRFSALFNRIICLEISLNPKHFQYFYAQVGHIGCNVNLWVKYLPFRTPKLSFDRVRMSFCKFFNIDLQFSSFPFQIFLFVFQEKGFLSKK